MSTPIENRRRHVRQPVQLPALAVTDDGLRRLQATIIDVSISGAKLALDPADELPPSFYMLLPEHRLQPCRLVWRRGHHAGVSYQN